MQESQQDRDPGTEGSKPPEEPHPDEPRGSTLPPADDPATEPDPDGAGDGDDREDEASEDET
ncbi:MAG TPA: hypothetical protein VKA89_11135 [Solirubrobacterales bacterium]|nr:hypothetical protein [Solirubrobacterales bacterium]